ncbi:MAG: AbrB/MazE/SpoVT family DNA-binding domain-containing protein [Chloroflexota bacterium]
MVRVKVSSKNQIAMPSMVRRKLNIRPGPPPYLRDQDLTT